MTIGEFVANVFVSAGPLAVAYVLHIRKSDKSLVLAIARFDNAFFPSNSLVLRTLSKAARSRGCVR